MKKRIIIVHRWDGSPDTDWYPWLKKELEDRNFEVSIPLMPDANAPEINKWMEALTKAVGKPNKDIYLIGHSIGCQTILRYLAKLPENAVIGGVIFVAGWITLSSLETDEEKLIAGPWLTKPIDFGKVRLSAKKFVAIFSDDDPFVPLENVKLFERGIGAITRIERNKGHFNDIAAPAVLQEIIQIAG